MLFELIEPLIRVVLDSAILAIAVEDIITVLHDFDERVDVYRKTDRCWNEWIDADLAAWVPIHIEVESENAAAVRVVTDDYDRSIQSERCSHFLV